jgi:hypothetical protein
VPGLLGRDRQQHAGARAARHAPVASTNVGSRRADPPRLARRPCSPAGSPFVAVRPPNPGPPRGDADHGHADRHDHDGGSPGRGIRVRRLAGRVELPDPEWTPCYTPSSGDADYLGSGCPNGRAFDDIDTATELGRFGDSRTGDHTGTNGVPCALGFTGTLGQPECDSGTQRHANPVGRAHAKRNGRADALTNARTNPVPNGEAAANAASVCGPIDANSVAAIAVTARRAVRVLPFRTSGRQQRKK